MPTNNRAKSIRIVVAILVLVIAAVYAVRYSNKHEAGVQDQSVTIAKKEIKEENFSGSTVAISGDSVLAVTARNFTEKEIADFRERANLEVPDIRKEFGDVPPSHYTIDIAGTLVSGSKTQSIVLNEYIYTGGANGLGLYTVFTADKTTGKLLSLKDVLVGDKQAAFLDLLKKRLLDTDANENLVGVFRDDVNALTYDKIPDFAFDDTSLIIYFDKYAIGPGALGEIAFKIPLADLTEYLSLQ